MQQRSAKPEHGAPSLGSCSSTNLRRRRFLFSLGASSAGAAVAAVAAAPAVATVTPAAETKAAGTGYQETEHVRHYYRSARI